jgi:hypothetical protein
MTAEICPPKTLHRSITIFLLYVLVMLPYHMTMLEVHVMRRIAAASERIVLTSRLHQQIS